MLATTQGSLITTRGFAPILPLPKAGQNQSRSTIAVHLVGHLDTDGSDYVTAQLWKLAEDGNPSIVVFADQLRLRNFSGFRSMAEGIQNLRDLGRDVRISVTSAPLRAVLQDMRLDEACVYGQAALRADRHVLIGNPELGKKSPAKR